MHLEAQLFILLLLVVILSSIIVHKVDSFIPLITIATSLMSIIMSVVYLRYTLNHPDHKDRYSKDLFTSDTPDKFNPTGVIDTEYSMGSDEMSREASKALYKPSLYTPVIGTYEIDGGSNRVADTDIVDKVEPSINSTQFTNELYQSNQMMNLNGSAGDDLSNAGINYQPNTNWYPLEKQKVKESFEAGPVQTRDMLKSWIDTQHSEQDSLGLTNNDAKKDSLDSYKAQTTSMEYSHEPFPSVNDIKNKTDIRRGDWRSTIHNRLSSDIDTQKIEQDRWRNSGNKSLDSYYRSRYSGKLKQRFEQEFHNSEKSRWWGYY